MTEPREQERANKQEQPGPAQADLREVLELLLTAVMPLVPINGSWTGGYWVSKRIDTTLRASVEEWAEAAYWFCEAHRFLVATDRAREPDLTREEARALLALYVDPLAQDSNHYVATPALIEQAVAKLRAFLASGDEEENG